MPATPKTTTVITWRTHKVARGFEWIVYSFGYQQPTDTLKFGVARTRAIAMRLGKQWTIYLQGCRRLGFQAGDAVDFPGFTAAQIEAGLTVPACAPTEDGQ